MSVGLTLNSTLPLSEGHKIWITLFFILTFSGIVISGIWIFKYGVTTEDIDNGNRIDSKNKEKSDYSGFYFNCSLYSNYYSNHSISSFERRQ